MEFVLLMCLPIVIMTQMPAFQDEGLPTIVVIALSIIIVFPVLLVMFFLIRLAKGIWKEFKAAMADLARMGSSANVAGDRQSVLRKAMSWNSTANVQAGTPSTPDGDGPATRANKSAPLPGTMEMGIELAASDLHEMHQQLAASIDYDENALGQLSAAGMHEGPTLTTTTNGAGGESVDVDLDDIQIEDIENALAEIERLSIDMGPE